MLGQAFSFVCGRSIDFCSAWSSVNHTLNVLCTVSMVCPFNLEQFAQQSESGSFWIFVSPVFVFCFFWLCRAACRTSQPGIEPVPPAVEARSLNHWTTREVPPQFFLVVLCLIWPEVCVASCLYYISKNIQPVNYFIVYALGFLWLKGSLKNSDLEASEFSPSSEVLWLIFCTFVQFS